MWFLESGFIEILEEWWIYFSFAGTPSFVLWLMKALKTKLKICNRYTFGKPNTRLKQILEEIQSFDILAEDNILTQEQIVEKLKCKTEFEHVTQMEETAWRIKSNSQWLKEGDRNTYFFMNQATARRRYNRIRQLCIDENLMSDKFKLQEHIVGFYSDLFYEEEIIRPSLEGIEFDNINSIESNILDAGFSEDEVLQEIKDLGQDKAPWPDGFPIMFIVLEFQQQGCIDFKHNTTFITLIPKRDYIKVIKYYRLICLLTSVYKIIAKVLASRLKLVMDKLLSLVQCAYMEGRQIIYGTLIANELVDSRLKSGKPGVICKSDPEKSFDRVNWSYLESVLRKMGFSTK